MIIELIIVITNFCTCDIFSLHLGPAVRSTWTRTPNLPADQGADTQRDTLGAGTDTIAVFHRSKSTRCI